MELRADETGTAIVPVLACVLNQLCNRNDQLPITQAGVTKFHALRPPAISIRDYLERIAKYAACSGECFVLALVYVDRIIQTNPNFVVNSLNIHRLLITSVMLAAKFFDDQYFNNAYYAKVGGVPSSEMNTLEVEFLFMTNFTLFVPSEIYRQYYTELCNHARNSSCGCTTLPIPELVFPSFPRETDYINSTQGLVHLPADITNSGKFKSYPSGSTSGVSDLQNEGRDRNNSNQDESMQPKDEAKPVEGFGGSGDGRDMYNPSSRARQPGDGASGSMPVPVKGHQPLRRTGRLGSFGRMDDPSSMPHSFSPTGSPPVGVM